MQRGSSYEGTPPPASSGPPPEGERRVALVIGNGQYAHATALKNPRNDAIAMNGALEALGFEVVGGEHTGIDLSYAAMAEQIRNFRRKLGEGADVGLLYFAGHGMQVHGRNYLVPIDAAPEGESDVSSELFELQPILADMERPRRVSIVLLNACRNNPLAQNLARTMGHERSRDVDVAQGLAVQGVKAGTIIAYATQPGHVAYDGARENGFFTEALLEEIANPGREIELMLKDVRIKVEANTRAMKRGPQVPWVHTSLLGSFCFRAVGAVNVPDPPPSVQPQHNSLPDRAADKPAIFWSPELTPFRVGLIGVSLLVLLAVWHWKVPAVPTSADQVNKPPATTSPDLTSSQDFEPNINIVGRWNRGRSSVEHIPGKDDVPSLASLADFSRPAGEPVRPDAPKIAAKVAVAKAVVTHELQDSAFNVFTKSGEADKQKFKEITGWYETTFEYPKNNKVVATKIFKLWNEFAKENGLKNYTDAKIARRELLGSERTDAPEIKITFHGEYTIVSSAKYITYIYTINTSTGGAHGSTNIVPISLNKNGVVVDIEEILPIGELERVAKIAKAQIIEEKIKRMQSRGQQYPQEKMSEREIADAIKSDTFSCLSTSLSQN